MGPKNPVAPRATLAKRLALLAVSLGVTLLLAELALRVAFPAEKRYFVWSPGTSRVSHPDQTVARGTSVEARFTINDQGIRGKSFGADSEYRILAIGGSTTEGMYVDDDDAWPAVVGKALPTTLDGRPVWVGNVGRSGMNSRDNLVHLKYLTAQYPRIDAVLLLVGINDLTVALSQADHYASPPLITNPEAERAEVLRAFMIVPGKLQEQVRSTDRWLMRTALFQLGRRTYYGAGAHRRRATQDETGQNLVLWRSHRAHASSVLRELPSLEAPLADYRRNLNLLVDESVSRHVRLILMTQPALWRRDISTEDEALLWLGGVGGAFHEQPGAAYYAVTALLQAMRRFNEVTLEVCAARRLDCIDLAALLPASSTMFYDDVHFTLAGSHEVARLVAEHLRSLPPFAKGHDGARVQ